MVSDLIKIDLNPIIENWLSQIAYSHSNSENTRTAYIHNLQKFLDHIRKTPDQILNEYDSLDEKQFKRFYSTQLISFLVKLQKEGYSPATQQIAVNAIKSFFKYNNLPLNYIATGRKFVTYHNRDIRKEEIEEIIKIAEPREKAFYGLMVQSGLRPNEICNLKIENLEKLLDENTPIPCLIKINQEQTKGQYSEYFTFTAKESIYYLKEYLKRRKQPLKPEEHLFTKEDSKTAIDTDLISHMFRRTVTKLKDQKILDFKNKAGDKSNRNELRLYNLRKYFRNHTGEAGSTFVNFWMGHSLGVDDHYFSKEITEENIEKHRKIYAEQAMPNLRLESKTPNQTEKTILELETKIAERDQQIQAISDKLAKFEPLLDLLVGNPQLNKMLQDINEGRFIRIETEHTQPLAMIPMKVLDELMKKPEIIDGEEAIVFDFDQVRDLSRKLPDKVKKTDQE
jgi:integrase